MWLRNEKNDKYADRHTCDLPDLSGWSLLDHRRVTKWRWMCPVCGNVYKPLEGDYGYDWVRLWPWNEWRWQKRSGMVF